MSNKKSIMKTRKYYIYLKDRLKSAKRELIEVFETDSIQELKFRLYVLQGGYCEKGDYADVSTFNHKSRTVLAAESNCDFYHVVRIK